MVSVALGGWWTALTQVSNTTMPVAAVVTEATVAQAAETAIKGRDESSEALLVSVSVAIDKGGISLGCRFPRTLETTQVLAVATVAIAAVAAVATVAQSGLAQAAVAANERREDSGEALLVTVTVAVDKIGVSLSRRLRLASAATEDLVLPKAASQAAAKTPSYALPQAVASIT